MRFSTLLINTLKEAPNDAELISHQLMLRASLIRKLSSGIYSYLPLGLRVLRKIEHIIREEMQAIGAQELLLPSIIPKELWEETKRWEQFGPQLLKLKDRHQRDFCIGPTHEEVITDVMRKELKSYKQLPVVVYQIQNKFRDEIRPRFGVMRAREFLMKDAYCFHLDEASLDNTYQAMYGAYSKIFTRMGLNWRAVLADTGSIGGASSHEFHILADSGEDIIAFSNGSDYAANIELATHLIERKQQVKSGKSTKVFNCQETTTHAQAKALEVPVASFIKTMLVKGATLEAPIVALVIRGDHELNFVKAAHHPLVASPCTLIAIEDAVNFSGCKSGFIGPCGLNIPIIVDYAVADMSDFFCGNNKDNELLGYCNWQQNATYTEVMDLRNVIAGDKAVDGKGELELKRGIEVGHIFKLGDKYSVAMDATVLDANGRKQPLLMGCYGIGVSRIMAAAIEQNHDDKGIIWPSQLAPFKVIISPINYHKIKQVEEACLALYNSLQGHKIEVLLDDRNERAGVMFNDADLLGIPHRLVLSEKLLAENKIEYKNRKENTTHIIELDLNQILKLIGD